MAQDTQAEVLEKKSEGGKKSSESKKVTATVSFTRVYPDGSSYPVVHRFIGAKGPTKASQMVDAENRAIRSVGGKLVDVSVK